MYSKLILILLLFNSCLVDGERIDITPYHLLTDNSAKVWILNEEINSENEIVNYNREDKMTIVFYKDKSFVMNRLKNFGQLSVLTGTFILSSDKKVLTFKWFDDSEAVFVLKELQNNRMKFSGNLSGKTHMYVYTTMDKRVYKYDIENDKTIESSNFY